MQAAEELELWDTVARDLTDLGSARKMVDGLIAIERDERRHAERMAKQEAKRLSQESHLTQDDGQTQRERVPYCSILLMDV